MLPNPGTKVYISTFTPEGKFYDELTFYSEAKAQDTEVCLNEAAHKVPQKDKDYLVEIFDGRGYHNKVLIKK